MLGVQKKGAEGKADVNGLRRGVRETESGVPRAQELPLTSKNRGPSAIIGRPYRRRVHVKKRAKKEHGG